MSTLRGRPKAWVPFAPLAARMDRLQKDGSNGGQAGVLEALGVSSRSWYRWKRTGRLGIDQADEAAVLFGCHPSEIWGNAFYEAAAIADGVAS